MTRLTSNFTLEELIRSTIAEQLGIDNTPGRTEVRNLKNLAVLYLQPLRERFGPIHINSGYRCKDLNKAVKGVDGSWHTRGSAADIKVSSLLIAAQMISFLQERFVKEGVGYDEICLSYRRKTGNIWLHVAFNPLDYENRMKTKLMVY